MPVGDIREPFVDAEDIADVAFAALTDDQHIGKVYELTGPRLLSLPEVADILSRSMGRPVEFVSVSVADYARELLQHGFSADEALPAAQLIADVLDGRNPSLAGAVQPSLILHPVPCRESPR